MTNATLTLVGWDDALCRPIYRRCYNPTSSKKQRDKKKSDVTLGPSSLSTFHQPSTPDECDRVSSKRNINDDDMTSCCMDKYIAEKGSGSRHKSRGESRPAELMGQHSTVDCHFSATSYNSPKPMDVNLSYLSSVGLNCQASTQRCSESVAVKSVEDLVCEQSTYQLEDIELGRERESTESVENDRCSEAKNNFENTRTAVKDDESSLCDQCAGHKSVCLQTGSTEDNMTLESDQQETAKNVMDRGQDKLSNISEEASNDKEECSPSFESNIFDLVECSYLHADSIDSGKLFIHASTTSSKCSPMFLESNRESFEPLDNDTISISLFGGADSKDETYANNRRSFGKNNRPNWTSTSSTLQKINDTKTCQKQLVGWDDIKCRPIYQVVCKPESTQSDQIEESSCADDNTSMVQNRTLKRAYSSSFRKSELFKAARHSMDVYSPVSRRVTMENEIKGGKTGSSSVGFARKNCPDVGLSFDLASNESSCHQQCDSESYKKNIEKTIQPTSKSTIASARAFFRYLDSNHHLNITSDKEYNVNANVVRTTRKIRHSDQLKNEYRAYCRSVDTISVDPISMNEFATHWNMYFTRQGIIRDGLLDED